MTNLYNAPDRDPGLVIIQQPTRTEYVDRHVTITENRAPTDASVKLLREMEAKAETEVLKAVSVTSNGFSCVVHQMLDAMSDKMIWRAVFKLNDKQMVAKIETAPHLHPQAGDLHATFAKLRDEMAKVIAGEVLNEAFCAAMQARYR